MNSSDVFISYRRDGGDMTAMYIYQELRDRGYSVFYDVEVLRSGKFNEDLLRQIQSCRDFVVVLSLHALDRCNDEGDWVRQEIAEAIRCEKNIIPVMMNGFHFPDKLPEDIDSLRTHTGLVSSAEYFQESMNRLCEKYLTSKPRKKKWLLPVLCTLIVLAGLVLGSFLSRGWTKKPPDTVEAVLPAAEVSAAANTEAPIPETPAPRPKAEGALSGTALNWTLGTDGVLTISGSGEMHDFNKDKAPWVIYEADIRELSVDDGVTHIGSQAFQLCRHLRAVSLPQSVKSIGDAAFYGCSELRLVRLPDGLWELGASVFDNCKNLRTVVLPEGVARIGSAAFNRCSGLEEIYIPDSVTAIDSSAFNACNKLKSVFFGGSESDWARIQISGYNKPLSRAVIEYDADPSVMSSPGV